MESTVENGAWVLVWRFQIHNTLRSKMTIENEGYCMVVKEQCVTFFVVFDQGTICFFWVLINGRVIPVAVESLEVGLG